MIAMEVRWDGIGCMVNVFFVLGAIEVKRKEKIVNVTCSFMPIDFRPGFTSFYLST